MWLPVLYEFGSIDPGTPRVMQRLYGLMFRYESLRFATSHAARSSAAGRVGTRPLGGSATMDVRRVGTMWSRGSNQKKL